jgi:RNA polymerase sigma factor (sigma-70 family)
LEINDLHKLASAGDKDAEEALFAGLSARFRLFARQRTGSRSEAEEVTQEALKTIYEKYRDIEFETSFSGWAYQVLNNKLMTTIRTRDRRRDKLAEAVPATESIPRDTAPGDLEARLLKCLRAVNKVNPRHARILNLHHLGYQAEEICSRLKLNRSNFYSILSRARSLLERCLKEGKIS